MAGAEPAAQQVRPICHLFQALKGLKLLRFELWSFFSSSCQGIRRYLAQFWHLQLPSDIFDDVTFVMC